MIELRNNNIERNGFWIYSKKTGLSFVCILIISHLKISYTFLLFIIFLVLLYSCQEKIEYQCESERLKLIKLDNQTVKGTSYINGVYDTTFYYFSYFIENFHIDSIPKICEMAILLRSKIGKDTIIKSFEFYDDPEVFVETDRFTKGYDFNKKCLELEFDNDSIIRVNNKVTSYGIKKGFK
jgi:hypothetical protein